MTGISRSVQEGMVLAHALAPGMGGLLNGVLHPLLGPAHWLTLAGGALWAGQSGEKQARGFLVGIPAGVAVAFLMKTGNVMISEDLTRIPLLATMSIGGGLTAANLPAATPITSVTGFVIATLIAVQTFAEDVAEAPGFAFATGVFLSLSVTAILIAAASRSMSTGRPWKKIAVRVAGSWILALGILMLALPAK